MPPPLNRLLPLSEVITFILLKRSEVICLARAQTFLESVSESLKLDTAARLGLAGFVAIRSKCGTTIVRRLRSLESGARTGGARVLTEGGAEGAGEEHYLESVLEDDPTEDQWKEACAEFVKGMMQGQLGHIFMQEIKATSERLARLQRCADVLAVYGAVAPGQGPGGSQDGDLDVRLYDGLRYALRAPAMHEGIWSRWCTELRKCIWGLESAQRVASHGCLDPPAQQLPEQQPLEQHQTLKQEWPPEQAHQPLPPVQQAPLDPASANGDDGSAPGEWQTHRHADGHVGAAVGTRGGVDSASDCDAALVSAPVRGDDDEMQPSRFKSPVSRADAFQDTRPTAARPGGADEAILRRRDAGHASRSRSPPRLPSPVLPPSPRRRQYPVTAEGDGAPGPSQRTPPQPRPQSPLRFRSRPRSRSRSRSPRRPESGFRPRSPPVGVFGVSDRPYGRTGEAHKCTEEEWSEAVFRFLTSQPGGSAELSELRRRGLGIPNHLLEASGKRPSGYLYKFPRLWTVSSDKRAATRGMILTALP
ncbi:hypothetical protein PLESTF_001381600 [Pleodorina starrii]|nr:hypothetical protein PLESTM_000330500 [Pleodorina starrii]GLC73472.1 hypothetical protein PLESTF_001381600 [Pleodorina starrii]